MTETETFQDMALLQDFIIKGLVEDVGEADHTSEACIPADNRSRARLLVKDAGVIAGVELAKEIFNHVDPNSIFERKINDGESVSFGDVAFEVECNSRALLKAERLVLNSMQRMSGIATLSNRFKFEVEDLPVTILDTRKTTPLIRFLEKWAVKIGGCSNYRDGLYDWIMIKDNHIDACGGISQAIQSVLTYQKENGLKLGVTVEVRNLVELDEVLRTGNIDRIMLDNFELPLLREAIRVIDRRFETEASGGVTINTVRSIAMSGVDFVSVGALTHSAQGMDMSLKIVK
ncbi:MAG: carboxylating nicotinate-nucleotide diphosphorylase [Bacteroidota bacterium]